MKRWGLLIAVLLVLVAAGVTVKWWLAPLLALIGAKTDLIQGLADAIQIGLWLIAGIAGFFAWWRGDKKTAVPNQITKIEKRAVNVAGPVTDSVIVTGNQNRVILKPAGTNAKALREAYLSWLFESARQLSLTGIDPKAASDPVHGGRHELDAVYTALRTQTAESFERMHNREALEKEHRRLSALEQLNRHPRLVLLGDPGSGKSTFVNFVALCLAGEARGDQNANLQLLTAPLPKEKEDEKEQPAPQPWDHGALLPVRIILRDFAAGRATGDGKTSVAVHRRRARAA